METNSSTVVDKIIQSPNFSSAPGNIADVFIAADGEFENPTDIPKPLYRGHGMSVNYQGLKKYQSSL